MTCVAIIGHIIWMFWSITSRFIRLNALSASTNKIASISSSLKIELKECTAASHPARWPLQSCKSLAFSRMFLLKVVITTRPRILPIPSPIPIGLASGFLSTKISLHAKKASSDPSFPQYLFKHNFFAMSAIALQRSQLSCPNDDEVRMRRHPFASRFHGPAASLISCAALYIRSPFFFFICIFFM